MKLADLSKEQTLSKLKGQGIKFKVGLFNICIRSAVSEIGNHLYSLYGAYDCVEDDDFIDFYTELAPPYRLRRFIRPQVNFFFDGFAPFNPLPYNQASAMFEWGLNWCIANHAHQYLVIHAAVVEHNNQVFILPGAPGSGKSTLCAALVCEGWRLLSDEMVLLSIADRLVYPAPRPISLKNRSLDIIASLSADLVFGQIVTDTAKGTVGHLRAPEQSVALGTIPARPTQIIFPHYQDNVDMELSPLSKARTLIKIAENCFNYHILGIEGFNSIEQLVDSCDCFQLTYSQLDEAMTLFRNLAS